MRFTEQEMGENVREIREDENRTVFHVKGDSGEGLMTLYQVFKGCYLMYNDFHMKECCSGFKPSAQIFCIDHCREGRIEWCVDRNRYIYVDVGRQIDGNANSELFFRHLSY